MAGFITLEELKLALNITGDEYDETLEYLIDQYTLYIIEETGIAESNPKTQRALYAAIACHLERTHPELISRIESYTIGDVTERFAGTNRGWCEEYNDAISELRRAKYPLVTAKRRGIGSALRRYY
ncbi:hypothetical protein [Methanobacterium virus PhiF1]|nr:hypothetical protein [Methanobacterium virus PhiF1]